MDSGSALLQRAAGQLRRIGLRQDETGEARGFAAAKVIGGITPVPSYLLVHRFKDLPLAAR